jgi:hypothetical protein
MKLGTRQWAGFALVIVGFLMVSGVWAPLAEVIYDPTPPVINPIMPSGTLSAPTPVRQGDSVALSAYVADAESGILNGHVSVYVGDLQTLDKDYLLGTQGGSVYRSYQNYIIPAGEGQLYAVQFYGTNNNMMQTIVTAYMRTMEAPNGVFYINNIAVTPSSVIHVTDPALALKFQATKSGGEIVRCYVEVWKDGGLIATVDLAETATDATWTGAYTLGTAGTYTLVGKITNQLNSFTLMSISFDMGTMPFNITMSTIVGAISLIFGIYLLAGKKNAVA